MKSEALNLYLNAALQPQPNRGTAVSAVIHGRDARATMFSAPREEDISRDSNAPYDAGVEIHARGGDLVFFL
jgi:hypothetical protein